MRGLIPALACACGLGCTAPNPEFGDTGLAETTASTGAGSTSASTTDPTTDSTTDPSAGPTSDTGTVTGASETSTGSVAEESSPTTGVEANHCCGEDDCEDPIRACLCELTPNCCEPPWGEECRGIAIACDGSCDGEVFPCCVPHPEPACSGVALLPGFCLAHAECCLLEWTPTCVSDYDLATGECGLESCAESHPSPGCDDPVLMECVCTEEGQTQCCTEVWDAACAELAAAC
jgi:hypothetical protein